MPRHFEKLCIMLLLYRRVASNVLSIGDVSGAKNIANLWKLHFEGISDSATKAQFYKRLGIASLSDNTVIINTSDVTNVVEMQKRVKRLVPTA